MRKRRSETIDRESALDIQLGCHCLCDSITASSKTQRLEAYNTVLDCINCEESGGLYYSDHTDIAVTKEDKNMEKKGHLVTKKDCDDFLIRYVGFINPDVIRVIFNPPATIVFWTDGTKTVVKCAEGEKFDPYTGFCYAFTERYFGPLSRIRKVCQKRSTGLPEASKAIVEGVKEETERSAFEKQAVAYMRRAICDKFSEGWSIDQIAKRFKMSQNDISEALRKEFE